LQKEVDFHILKTSEDNSEMDPSQALVHHVRGSIAIMHLHHNHDCGNK